MRVFIRDVNKIISVKSDINFEIVHRFTQENIDILFNQQDTTLENVDEIGAALGEAIKGIGSGPK